MISKTAHRGSAISGFLSYKPAMQWLRAQNKYMLFSITLCAALFLFAGIELQQALSKRVIPIYKTIDNFQLKDSSNARFQSDQLKKNISLYSFIFTRCHDVCPRITQDMKQIQHKFSRLDGFRLVSITVDPEYDTAATLAKYAKTHLVDLKNWFFLTGDRTNIKKIMRENFKLGFAEDPMFHSDRLVLVDEQARIRGYYQSSETKDMLRLNKDITQLLAELKITNK